jgi:hypothetical protein
VVKKSPPEHPQGTVGGTFELVESADGDPPVKIVDGNPFVTGGACLVFQDMRHVLSCNTQDDCASNPPHGPENGFGYCHQASKTCWFKKESTAHDDENGYKVDDYCIKSTPARTLVLDRVNEMPTPKGPPNTTRWRLTACQGITPVGCAGGVEGVDLRTYWGDVLEP